jgi:hypothetical protein
VLKQTAADECAQDRRGATTAVEVTRAPHSGQTLKPIFAETGSQKVFFDNANIILGLLSSFMFSTIFVR